MQEALECARGISDDYFKSQALKDISAELAKQEKIEDALECARGINDDRVKSKALNDISAELAKQGKIVEAASVMLEALECARGINDDRDKSSALMDISAELAKQGNLPLAEQISLEIPFIADRQNCWKGMANSIKEMHGWHAALEKVQKLQTEEAHLFFIKGWAENLSPLETDKTCLKEALPLLAEDTQSIENLLQAFALHELMLGKITKERSKNLNKVLNIQWAIDIVNNFPKELNTSRNSANVETWIQDIEDEDEREDILSWAEKVRSGKMTEEKFENKLKQLQ
jgi:hypothetical protein